MEEFTRGRGMHLNFRNSEINNLYRLTPKYQIESQNYIELSHFLDGKKYAHIFLKELFFILKPGGYLIIEYKETSQITFKYMEHLLWWLFKGNYIIQEHTSKKAKNKLIVQKLHSLFHPDDSIDKWTFGIITNGERDDWLEEMIVSIRNQKIPHYEIIVCGKYKNRPEKDFTYIEFNERADLGWITRKKNLIGQRAKYQNLMVIHDRLVLDRDWYRGMKKYGNAFELLGCVQREKSGSLAGDWLTLGGPVPTNYRVSSMDYTDWDWWVYLSGQLTIIKKNIWEKVLWDETRYWNDAEDADITYRARDMGYITRFNPFSSVTALAWRHGRLPLLYRMSEGLLPRDMYGRRLMRLTSRVIYRTPFLKEAMLGSYKWVSKTGLYKKLIYS